jgi:hypothetical protein
MTIAAHFDFSITAPGKYRVAVAADSPRLEDTPSFQRASRYQRYRSAETFHSRRA